MTTPTAQEEIAQMRARYNEMTRNLPPEDLALVESETPLKEDLARDPCSKILSARKLWCEINELEAIVSSIGGNHGAL